MIFNSINCCYCGIEMNYNILISSNFLFFYHVSCCQALLTFHMIKRTQLYVKRTHLFMVFGYENKNIWEKHNTEDFFGPK